MSENKQILEFIDELTGGFSDGKLLKVTLGKPRYKSDDLKNIYIRPVEIKNSKQLQFVFRHNTRDVTKNFSVEQAVPLLQSMIGQEFLQANMFCTDKDIQLMISKKGTARILYSKPTHSPLQQLDHDQVKKRLIEPDEKIYLQKLGITNRDFKVIPKMQDKYRQINKYVEIIDSFLPKDIKNKMFRIVDMGSGKGYLTFALYDHLKNNRKIPTRITGVEMRSELVEQCNRIVNETGFSRLNFAKGSIAEYNFGKADMLIALHACDTATDDAIYKGIAADVPFIVVAPCCQKQLRKAMKPGNELQPVLKHGIFLERQAEILTDGLRMLYLEKFGYQTKAIEFISTEHTPKNVMIIARKSNKIVNNVHISAQIHRIMKSFNIDYHHLGRLLDGYQHNVK